MFWKLTFAVHLVFGLSLMNHMLDRPSRMAAPLSSSNIYSLPASDSPEVEEARRSSAGWLPNTLTATNQVEDYPLHPGFPVSIPGRIDDSAPTVVDLDNDGQNELVVGQYGGDIYAWDSTGAVRSGFPISTGGVIMSHLAFGDLNGNGELEIISGTGSNQAGQRGKVYVWRPDGTPFSDDWPQSVERFGNNRPSKITTAVLADIDNDDALEIIVGTNNNLVGTPAENQNLPVPDVYAWERNGDLMVGKWPAKEGPSILGLLAAGDFNKNGQPDILVGRDHEKLYAYDNQGRHLPGWPLAAFVDKDGHKKAIHPIIEYKRSGPTVADLDNDGRYEYIVAGVRREPDLKFTNTALLVLQADGSRHPAWQTPAEGAGLVGDGSSMWQAAAIADLDRDNRLDIIIATQDGWIRAYAVDKTLLWEFDYAHGEFIYASEPVIGDVDGDHHYEIVFGTHDPNFSNKALLTGLWILEHDGVPKFKQPLAVEKPGIKSPPSLADFDGDGRIEIIAASRTGGVYVWDTPARFNLFRLPWPVARYNLQRTAFFEGPGFDAVKTARPAAGEQGQIIDYTIRFERGDVPLTHTVWITDVVPAGLAYIPGTLQASHGLINDDLGPTLTWNGNLATQKLITLTYSVSVATAERTAIMNTVTLNSNPTGPFTRSVTVVANPEAIYLPLITRQD